MGKVDVLHATLTSSPQGSTGIFGGAHHTPRDPAPQAKGSAENLATGGGTEGLHGIHEDSSRGGEPEGEPDHLFPAFVESLVVSFEQGGVFGQHLFHALYFCDEGWTSGDDVIDPSNAMLHDDCRWQSTVSSSPDQSPRGERDPLDPVNASPITRTAGESDATRQAPTNPRTDTGGRLLTGLTISWRVKVLLPADLAICVGNPENFDQRISHRSFTRFVYRLMASLWQFSHALSYIGWVVSTASGASSSTHGRCWCISPYHFDHDNLR